MSRYHPADEDARERALAAECSSPEEYWARKAADLAARNAREVRFCELMVAAREAAGDAHRKRPEYYSGSQEAQADADFARRCHANDPWAGT